MEKIHGNVHVFVLSHNKNMLVSVYFLHLVLAFTPHYIIMDKGLLLNIWLTLVVPWQPYKSKAPPCISLKPPLPHCITYCVLFCSVQVVLASGKA